MRAPVYRNLDKPFEVLGFNALELTLLCFAFVAGGELTSLIGVHRVWAFLLTAVIALSLFLLRRYLGELFLIRLFRFAHLPKSLCGKLMAESRKEGKNGI